MQSETALAGAYEGNLAGYINNGAIGQMHLFLQPNRVATRRRDRGRCSHSGPRAAYRVRRAGRRRFRQPRRSGGIQQPIDEVVSTTARRSGAVCGASLSSALEFKGRDGRHDHRNRTIAAGRSPIQPRARPHAGHVDRHRIDAIRAAFGGASRRSSRATTDSRTFRSSIRSAIKRISRRCT